MGEGCILDNDKMKCYKQIVAERTVSLMLRNGEMDERFFYFKK